MKILIIGALFVAQIAISEQSFAENKSNKASPRALAQDDGIKVIPYNEDWPTEDLQNPIYKVESRARNPIQQVVVPDLRDEALIRSGAMAYVEKWDHLEKDMLLLRLKNMPFSAVEKNYHMIPKKVLLKLKKELQ